MALAKRFLQMDIELHRQFITLTGRVPGFHRSWGDAFQGTERTPIKIGSSTYGISQETSPLSEARKSADQLKLKICLQ